LGHGEDRSEGIKMKYVALVDCNSFYCSCEKIFRPDLRNKPVIVLSNNDGAAIAFTKEAKALGFGQMCEAFFKIKDRVKKNNVAIFSSNYTFYDDISKRVMNVLREFSPKVEVYSVDEAFVEIEADESFDLDAFGRKMRSEIFRRIGMPVGVGISLTKVLAKVANKISKKNNGVCVLVAEKVINEALRDFPVRDLWGVGERSAIKLNMYDIRTALEFKRFQNDALIQKLLTKVGREIQNELRGINCLSLETPEDKKNTGNSRSFSHDLYCKEELKEALAQFATNAAQKLRKQKSVCYSMSAFIYTNPFKSVPQYFGEGAVRFTSGTNDTLKIISGAHAILDQIFRPGFGYKKGGVLLNHIVPESQSQMDIFDHDHSDNKGLNEVMDMINKKYGPHTIKSAACGINQEWKTTHAYISRHYTTDWNDLLEIEL
jgi:DNA polymerase V